ncbi:hypothetical protein [Alterisphingorhabdus coralli]|uniref:Uncharacterized protein n=1 Tax=Alterisphingorhabdus coralli TaxID=3071408 RepID=A0AA97I0V7_9SPHN|nr:hypothetical protein [Parasphingorhabdus sp. SCSIO 66989]WOE75407.1 hypothetical protein RB602_01440 [Parasphingorhabdus sp. SCSIO 66989]
MTTPPPSRPPRRRTPQALTEAKLRSAYSDQPERIRYFKRVSPSGAINDLVEMLKWDSPWRIRFLALAGALTVCVAGGFMIESSGFRIEPRKFEIDYVDLPPLDETEAQKEARYERNRIERDARLQANRERFERSKQFYRELGEATGVDVDDE